MVKKKNETFVPFQFVFQCVSVYTFFSALVYSFFLCSEVFLLRKCDGESPVNELTVRVLT